MKSGAVYRLKTPTIAAARTGGEIRPVPVTLPANTVLTVVEDEAGNSTGFVRVLCEGRVVTMFSIDLAERGELVESAAG